MTDQAMQEHGKQIDSHFGGCPVCGNCDRIAGAWGMCDMHELFWPISREDSHDFGFND